MTREEQIKQASLNNDSYIVAAKEVDCVSFQDGARWADAHPNWHKYPEDPPHEETQYLVITANEAYIIAKYEDDEFCDLYLYDFERFFDPLEDQEVIAWMELPQSPKFK